jgi:hypothetical protein
MRWNALGRRARSRCFSGREVVNSSAKERDFHLPFAISHFGIGSDPKDVMIVPLLQMENEKWQMVNGKSWFSAFPYVCHLRSAFCRRFLCSLINL